MKNLVLCLVCILCLSNVAFADEYTPDSGMWTWRVSNDEMSIYTYNAPPDFLDVDRTRNYIECAGEVLVVEPENPDYQFLKMKIKIGVQQKDHVMWMQYLQVLASDKNGQPVEVSSMARMDPWHSVLHGTTEELYGWALYMAFVDYVQNG